MLLITAPALILFDLDRFKAVNDRHGHAQGDALLLRVTQSLQRGLRPSDDLARIGGDEFVLLVEGLSPVESPLQAQAGTAAGDRTSTDPGSTGLT